MARRLLLGNTEVGFRFCFEEIFYICTIPNTERCEIILVNGQKYEVPNALNRISKAIDDELHENIYNGTEHSFAPAGKAFIINMAYLNDIGIDHVRFKADVGDTTPSILDVKLPRDVCENLAMARKLDRRAQRAYQQKHYPDGFKIIRKGSGFGTAFLVDEYVVIERDESYYDIDEGEIMFLGV